MTGLEPFRNEARGWIVRGFGVIEDVIYVGLGILLAGIALALLVSSARNIEQSIVGGSFVASVTALLDRILLTLLIVELLYTVQVSFSKHAIAPEPFLLVGLIAGIRRILLLTAEYGELHEKTDVLLRSFAIELAVLTALTVALVASLIMLRKTGSAARVERP